MDAPGDTPITGGQLDLQSAELAALRRMLTASEGTFSFSISICNSPSLRDYLISNLREESPSIEVIEIDKEATDILDLVRSSTRGGNSTGIFVIGIEKTLPSDRKEHKILRTLNVTREAWQSHFSCPVVFWLAEYAATLLSIHARDFWSWISHIFEFVSEQATAVAGMQDAYAGDIASASRLDADQKRFRIAELEQRISEAGDQPKSELVRHVLIWNDELAYIYRAIGDLDRAQKNITKVLEIAREEGLEAEMAISYGNLGTIHQIRGNLDQAEQMLKRALEIEEKLGRLEGMAIQYSNLALIYQRRGDLDKAEQTHKKSLEIEKKLGRLEGMSSSYGNLGLIYKQRGDLVQAEQMLKKALEIDEKVGRLEGMAIRFSNLGLIHQTRGDLGQAEKMHEKALDISEKLGLLHGMAIQYGNLGVIYAKRGDLEKAEQMYKKALEIDEKLGRREGIAIRYKNLGLIQQTRGDLSEARVYMKKALEIFRNIGIKPEIEKVQRFIDELDEQVKGKD